MPALVRVFKLAGLLVAVLALQACATSGAIQVARDQYRHGDSDTALRTLSEAKVSNRDQLLLHLDKGLIAQSAGRYNESILDFERALEIIEQLDYVSIKDQTASIITSEWAARYSGEYSERFWIHTFQMINYLLLEAPQSAAVEARRAVALYEEHEDVLRQDKFTRMLMALSFETAGQIDSARVEYRKLAKDFDTEQVEPLGRDQSELVVLIASGFIEPKLPGDLFVDFDARISFPYYAANSLFPPGNTVSINDETVEFNRSETALVSISQQALRKRGKAVAVRQALRLAAKHNIAESIEDKDALAGNIAKVLLFALEQADTRSWETLPAYLTALRIPLTPGAHTLSINALAGNLLTPSPGNSQTIEVELAAGERQFRLIRTGTSTY